MSDLLLGIKGYDYTLESSYYSMIQEKIYNESYLASIINKTISINESGITQARIDRITAIHEAELKENVKNKWNKFVTWLKGLFAKFMETLSNILLDEKKYLEKYKEIILKRRGKEDIDISYTGNYEVGVNRIINTSIPDFNYAKFGAALKADGYGEIIKLFNLKEFQYNDSDDLATQFKEYFLAIDKGETETDLSKVNFTTMYNFCYDYKKIEEVTKKDVDKMEKSSLTINNAINDIIKNNNANKPAENTATKQESALLEADGDNNNQQNNNTNNNNQQNDNNNTNNNNQQNNASTKISSKVGSLQINDNRTEEQKAADRESDNQLAASENKMGDIDNMINKWMSVCRNLITAKWTACQQIAKDYMSIIRTHVRSYGGTDLKKDTTSKKVATKGAEYQKDSEADQNKQDTK